MRNAGFIWIIALIMAAIDFYVFQVVKMLCSPVLPNEQKPSFLRLTGPLSIAIIILFLLLPLLNTDRWPKNLRNYLFATIVGFFFAKVLASVFFLVDDIRRFNAMGSSKNIFSEYRRRERSE